ncbi:MAG: mechanosensitive ion channel family protein [marine benthic group bacterium]|nr:mechanosensitive ion channel family protein [Candidatus Benthicola marisminoris]MCL7980823.1 mechanosensitive ion channel family protein [Gemmatimonadota bacterium]
MHLPGDWLTTELGLSEWLVGLVILPALGALLVFSVREVILRVVGRSSPSPRRQSWRKISLYVAVLASLSVTALAWYDYRSEISRALTRAGSDSPSILAGILVALLALAILWVVLYGIQRGYTALVARTVEWGKTWDGFHVQDSIFLDGDAFPDFVLLGLRLIRFVVVLLVISVFLPLFLGAIPATRPFSHEVMPLVFDPLRELGGSILDYIPSFIVLVLILVIARWVLQGLRALMMAVGRGDISLGSFDPDWADQTYRLLSVMVVLATIVIMYPLLPGSNSVVFQGFVVFVGALVTVGGSATMASIITGLVLTYTRSFRVGDRVKIGGLVGDVLEIGIVITKIRTLDNEQVSISNVKVLRDVIINYSSATAFGGLRLLVPVGIGYDTEWRDVYRLLIQAARATDNIKDTPAPFVQQSSLDDFAVTYTLAAFSDDPKLKPQTLTELRQNIQDAFNEAGIEIMTPSVRAVRDSLDPAMPARYLADQEDEK